MNQDTISATAGPIFKIGFPVFTMGAIALFILKLIGVGSFSWLWIPFVLFFPLIAFLAVIAVIFTVAMVIVLVVLIGWCIAALFKKKR